MVIVLYTVAYTVQMIFMLPRCFQKTFLKLSVKKQNFSGYKSSLIRFSLDFEINFVIWILYC